MVWQKNPFAFDIKNQLDGLADSISILIVPMDSTSPVKIIADIYDL